MWNEELPDNCPAASAKPPDGRNFYRLVKTFPPSDKDFWSHRKLYPSKTYMVSECEARSVSLFECPKACLKLKKLPLHINDLLVELRLPQDSGVVLKTFKNKHYSWWRYMEFNPIPCCSLAKHGQENN